MAERSDRRRRGPEILRASAGRRAASLEALGDFRARRASAPWVSVAREELDELLRITTRARRWPAGTSTPTGSARRPRARRPWAAPCPPPIRTASTTWARRWECRASCRCAIPPVVGDPRRAGSAAGAPAGVTAGPAVAHGERRGRDAAQRAPRPLGVELGSASLAVAAMRRDQREDLGGDRRGQERADLAGIVVRVHLHDVGADQVQSAEPPDQPRMSRAEGPPASGVWTPGAKAGSTTSRSNDRKTLRPWNLSRIRRASASIPRRASGRW